MGASAEAFITFDDPVYVLARYFAHLLYDILSSSPGTNGVKIHTTYPSRNAVAIAEQRGDADEA